MTGKSSENFFVRVQAIFIKIKLQQIGFKFRIVDCCDGSRNTLMFSSLQIHILLFTTPGATHPMLANCKNCTEIIRDIPVFSELGTCQRSSNIKRNISRKLCHVTLAEVFLLDACNYIAISVKEAYFLWIGKQQETRSSNSEKSDRWRGWYDLYRRDVNHVCPKADDGLPDQQNYYYFVW